MNINKVITTLNNLEVVLDFKGEVVTFEKHIINFEDIEELGNLIAKYKNKKDRKDKLVDAK